MVAQKPNHFSSVLGFASFKTYILYLQEVNKVNGVEIPFTLNIQTLMQCQFIFAYGHNGTISMDATFGTNDVKCHLFTLMGFDVHHTGMRLAWIITS